MSKFFNKLSNLSIFFILLFIILVLHIDILIAPLNSYFSGFDLKDLNYFINIRQYVANCLLNGIFPLWTTKIFCGMPFFANSETAILYPLNFIFLLLPISKAINISFILHFFILSFGVFLWIDNKLKDKLVSSIVSLVAVFASSFYLHACAGHLSNIITVVWFPYFLYFYDKSFEDNSCKYIFPLTTIICLQVFAGHFQYTYYCALISLLYALLFCRNKKVILTIFISYFFSLLLTSIQLLPSIEFYFEGARKTGILQSFSIKSIPVYLITLIFPKYTTSIYSSFWETTNYFGLFNILIVLVTIINFRKQSLIVKSVMLSLIIYLMSYSFFSQSLGKLIPFFTSFRSPIKLAFFVNILLLPVLAFGLKQILNDKFKFNKYVLFIIFCLAIFCVFFRTNINNFIVNYDNVFKQQLEYSVFIFSCLIALFCVLIYFKRFFIFKLLLILFVIIQPIIFVRQYSIMKFFLNPNFKYDTADETDVNKDARFFSNNFYNLLNNEENISGSIPDISINYYNFVENLNKPFNAKNIFGLLRCKCLINEENASLFEKTNVDILKRLNVFYDYRVVNNKEEIYKTLSGYDFNVFDTVILEKNPNTEIRGEGSYNLHIMNFDENSIEFECETTKPAIILYTDNYDKGWFACNIDNPKERYEVLCADYIYKAIAINEGKHKIRMEYKPKSFIWGKYISIISWILFVLSFFVFKRRNIIKQHITK